MTYDIDKMFNKLKMNDAVNRIVDELEERREKEVVYILHIKDSTQTAVTVNTRNEFNIKTLEQIIDDDKTRYEAPTKEQLCNIYFEFINNYKGHDLVFNNVNGSIYRKSLLKFLEVATGIEGYEYLINR